MVAHKQDRKVRARREKNRSPWFYLGMMGVVGWSVAVPTVVGALIGAWADQSFPGPLSWTLMGLAIGVLAGCLVAWGWVKQHGEFDKQRKDENG